MKKVAIIIALALLLISCGGGSVQFDATGTWEGTISGPFEVPATLNIVDDNGPITGTGTIFGQPGQLIGLRSGTKANIAFNSENSGDIEFRGTFSGNTYSGAYYVDSSQTATFSLQRQ